MELRMKQYLEIGKAVSTHGIRGELKLDPWCNDPTFVQQFNRLFMGSQHREVKIIRSRPHKNQVILKIEGIDTMDDAKALIGTVFYINRSDVVLPEGCYFEQDLIGLTVSDVDSGEVYGRLAEVIRTPANEVYSVISEEGKELYIPVIKEVIQSVDIKGGVMKIRPLKGLFEDED